MLNLAKTSLLTFSLLSSSALASDILVMVNGKNVTKQDAQAFVTASAPQANFAQLAPAEQKMITDRLVEKVLFIELASKEGIDKKPEFQRNMEKIKEELLVNMWMKAQMDNALVSDSEAKAFYDKNVDKFAEKSSMNARHILVKTQKDAEEIIAKLKDLKGEALRSGFIAQAKAKSTGPSGPKGGDLGTFSKGQMVPAFSKAVWSLKEGEMTLTPVKTQFGYHIIFLEKKSEGKITAYDKVKSKIIESLKQQQFTVKIKEIAKELRSKAKIVEAKTEEKTSK